MVRLNRHHPIRRRRNECQQIQSGLQILPMSRQAEAHLIIVNIPSMQTFGYYFCFGELYILVQVFEQFVE